MTSPNVSIIIPCYNEEKYIERCLESIIKNDYPAEKLEILIFDGISTDQTRNHIKEFQDCYDYIKLFDNPSNVKSTALNMGIEMSTGDIIMRMDAHAVYDQSYISKCVEYLMRFDVDNVGGIRYTRAGEQTILAECIAQAVSHQRRSGRSVLQN